MNDKKKKLCIFLHYFPEGYFPVYVQYYLNELYQYFDEVRMVTNRRTINNKPKNLNKNITIQYVKNEGYDFGMFYKAFHEINLSAYNQIACINDSNIIFGKLKFIFDWSKNQQVDFWGLVDSHESPWFSKHQNNYHIQSHFIVFNQLALLKLPDFFTQINYDELIKEKDPKTLRRKVINEWEIGLTQFLLRQDLSCRTYIDSYHVALTNGVLKPINVTFKLHTQLIKSGIPVIKKRLVMSRNWKNRFKYRSRWSRLIRKYGDKNWEIEELIADLKK